MYDQPIDLYRNEGATDYSHNVNVDDHGIAWTSGRGGILGYATRGVWRDPYMRDSWTAAKSVSRMQAVRAPAAQPDPYAPEPASSLSSGALICPAFRAG